jgi:ABC-type methionine transport system ATPase subunit
MAEKKSMPTDWLDKEIELVFGPTNLAQPLIWEMTRTHDVVFSLLEARVSDGEGRMRLRLYGPSVNLTAAENFLKSRGVRLAVLKTQPGKPPAVWPPQAESTWVGQRTIERKLWLTYKTAHYDRPIIWEMSRRFDTTFDIRQASLSGDFGIVGLLLKGPQNEVDRACEFLKESGLSVEPIDRDIAEG